MPGIEGNTVKRRLVMKTAQIPLCIVAVALSFQLPSRAVILFGTEDPNANTTPPAGSLANSGWQYQGLYGPFLGTVISSNRFITAKHVAGSSPTFQYQGQTYQVVGQLQSHPDSAVDLSIGTVNATFPNFASMSSRDVFRRVYFWDFITPVPSQLTVVHGRGGPRADAVFNDPSGHPCVTESALRGWKHPAYADGILRWGSGQAITYLFNSPSGLDFPATTTTIWKYFLGDSLNDFALSTGDSGGGLFVFDQGQWRLAGISWLIMQPQYKARLSDPSFAAAIFDPTGIYYPCTCCACTDGFGTDCPPGSLGRSYAEFSDIQWNLAWINSVLGKIRLNRLNYGSSLGFGFEVGGLIDGTTITVETSADLSSWQASANAQVQGWRYFYTDSDAQNGNVTKRFYRVRNSNDTRSDNCVGFYKTTIDNLGSSTDKTAILANQFISYHGDDLNALIPQAPVGTTIYKYDPITDSYSSSVYIGGTGYFPWLPDLTFVPGESFLVTIPANTKLDVVFYGEVQQSFSTLVYPGPNLISLPIPSTGVASEFGFTPMFGDTMYRLVDGTYQSSVYFAAWSPYLPAEPGEGFWYDSEATLPVTWTFNYSIW
jgi:hypothetical protein